SCTASPPPAAPSPSFFPLQLPAAPRSTLFPYTTLFRSQLARAAAPLMTEGGSIVTMTFHGAEKVYQGYNVMGVAKAALESSVRYLAADLGPRNIRVNAISAGPIQTLSARGVSGLSTMLKHHAERAPLHRNVEAREVGNTALFLCSSLSSGITGETIYVDCGYHIMGI